MKDIAREMETPYLGIGGRPDVEAVLPGIIGKAARDVNTANIFMAVMEFPAGEDMYPAEPPGALVVTATMKEAHRADRDGGIVQHDMRPAFHPMVIPNWRDCLTCVQCGYVLVTQKMFEQAPHWLKVYLAALYLEDWLMLVPETPEASA